MDIIDDCGTRPVFYFPTLAKYWLGSGDLNAEYKMGKTLQNNNWKITKTPSKLRQHINAGATDIIVIGHAAGPNAPMADQGIIAGGRILVVPKKQATEIGQNLHAMLADNHTVERVWVAACHSAQNGTATAIRNAIRPGITVLGTNNLIGSLFYYQVESEKSRYLAPAEAEAKDQELRAQVQTEFLVMPVPGGQAGA